MLSVTFNHSIDQQLLYLDSMLYKNEWGQRYSITKFKYYISNLHFTRTDGKEFISTESYLVDEESPPSKKIILKNIPDGDYTTISFIIGVDSMHNCSGAQSGALDVVNGMFWTWNTGYIFLKLEGKSNAAVSPGHIFEYHIGGYQQPSNSIRTISLKLSDALKIEKGVTTSLYINVNAGELLKTPTNIDFSKLPTVTDTKNAGIIADNYSDMFSIIPIQNEK